MSSVAANHGAHADGARKNGHGSDGPRGHAWGRRADHARHGRASRDGSGAGAVKQAPVEQSASEKSRGNHGARRGELLAQMRERVRQTPSQHAMTREEFRERIDAMRQERLNRRRAHRADTVQQDIPAQKRAPVQTAQPAQKGEPVQKADPVQQLRPPTNDPSQKDDPAQRMRRASSPAQTAKAAATGVQHDAHPAGKAGQKGGDSSSGGLSGILGGGIDLGSIVKKIFQPKTLLMAGLGALAGMVMPVIPGGPIGGALIGAGLSMLF